MGISGQIEEPSMVSNLVAKALQDLRAWLVQVGSQQINIREVMQRAWGHPQLLHQICT